MNFETILETDRIKVTMEHGKAIVRGKNCTVFTNQNASDLGFEIYTLQRHLQMTKSELKHTAEALRSIISHATEDRMSKPYLDASIVNSVIDDIAKEKSDRLQAVLSEMAENATSNGYHDHAEAINEALERLDEEGLLL